MRVRHDALWSEVAGQRARIGQGLLETAHISFMNQKQRPLQRHDLVSRDQATMRERGAWQDTHSVGVVDEVLGNDREDFMIGLLRCVIVEVRGVPVAGHAMDSACCRQAVVPICFSIRMVDTSKRTRSRVNAEFDGGAQTDSTT